ncbi:transcription factor bHLH144-like [Aristolochia californica]|uniref:transcription factor bHLH144-like n=1 Tax=Aristolochia californica TaxID=171875 RepID=UPI0035D584D8
MQRDQKFCPRKPASPIAYDLGGYTYNIPVVPTGNPMPGPVHGMGMNTTTNATKSFIIFDQTDNKCRIMFYPTPANKFSYPNFDFCTTTTYPLKSGKRQEDNDKESSSLKEDTRDIDALLSSEDDEEEDEEEVSTGRTIGNNYGGSSPDSSCSTDGSKSSKSRLSSIHMSCSSERKQQKMKKLMKVLRGIVPGGDQMDAAAVLDEAVRYLKSLKMEVKKLGIGNLKKHR